MNHQSAALPSLVRVIVEGASLAYTFEQGDSVRWNLYTGPISVTGTARCAPEPSATAGPTARPPARSVIASGG